MVGGVCHGRFCGGEVPISSEKRKIWSLGDGVCVGSLGEIVGEKSRECKMMIKDMENGVAKAVVSDGKQRCGTLDWCLRGRCVALGLM